ncbi:hypothetical protein Back11_01500 [Paenibacillus baekrokdamisoli]|uniref:Uncharacterized protein n=1 Tax=Paenibacillus baekrokdamisoli TaxID=1712516 RepID=A0A3G9IS74_9BACL|nr:hypothetical protein [Paenibacillus baekrokdamisoli]MBB3069222.1 sugar phosphate isomerase/epimerase [Paenibacillus baekrokdamisoli]BBH18805.1 hypothetical protein Back11_01500 [Paenibacillus baekrokdamisoli]
MKQKLGIGLQLYTLRDEMLQDMASVLQQVAEMGYEGVEFAGYYGYRPEQLKSFLSELSLKAIGSHVNMERLQNHLEEEIEMNVAIGSQYVILPGLNQDQRHALPETLVKPEQALVVTQILEAIYESSRTGKAIYFENRK